MSLIHLPKSSIFSNPETTCQRQKIQQILSRHKERLCINNRSSSAPKAPSVQKLNLKQALVIQSLHQKTSRTRKSSLNCLLKVFDEDSTKKIVNQQSTIDENRINLFRTGVYYRSRQRARGTGVFKKSYTERYQLTQKQQDDRQKNVFSKGRRSSRV